MKLRNILTVIACLLLASCQSNYSDTKSIVEDSVGSYETEDNFELITSNTKKNSQSGSVNKIIKRGFMSFEVKRLNIAKNKVDSLINLSTAYYEKENYQNDGYRNSYILLIRVPQSKFDSLISEMEHGIGKLLSKNISAEDVSEEYTDLNMRLHINLAYLEKYKGLLKQAKTIKEILEIQEKIRNIEEEIESKKGRLKYMDHRVQYSSLKIELVEITNNYSKGPSYSKKIVNSFKAGMKSFSNFLLILLSIWPYILLFSLIIILRKPILQKLQRRKK